MRRKILVFHPYLPPYRVDLYNYLSSLFEVVFFAYNDGIKGLGFDKDVVYKRAHFPFSRVTTGIKVGSQVISVVFFKQIRKVQPDVVLAHEFGFNTIVAILFKWFYNYKVIVTCDDSPHMAMECGGIRRVSRAFCIHHIDGLLVVNPQTKAILEDKFPGGHCSLIYLPIICNEQLFRQAILNVAGFANEEFLESKYFSGREIFVYVGRLAKEKNIQLLFHALVSIKETHKRAKLIIVGDGPERATLEQLAKALNLDQHIIFMGKLAGDDLYAVYALGGVLVLPSTYEPFGAVVNEALAAGCAVIVSNQAGSACLIEEGLNGYVFESENKDDLVRKMNAAVSSKWVYPTGALKPSRMPINFDNAVHDLVAQLKNDAPSM